MADGSYEGPFFIPQIFNRRSPPPAIFGLWAALFWKSVTSASSLWEAVVHGVRWCRMFHSSCLPAKRWQWWENLAQEKA